MEEKKKVKKKKDRSQIITLIERHIIREGHEYYNKCDEITYLAKNVYNATLYEQRQSFINGNFKNYYQVNKEFVNNNQRDYRALPTRVSKQVQMLSDQSFKSFFALLKLKQEGKYDKKVKLPKYLDKKKGRITAAYEKGAISLKKDGYVSLSQTGMEIKTKISREQIIGARIVPKRGYFVVEILYDVKKVKKKEKKNKYAFIDPGMNNLMTVTSNVFNPIIYSGRKIKSINQLANKNNAKRQSRMPLMRFKTGATIQEKIEQVEKGLLEKDQSKGMKGLWRKRDLRIKDSFHKITRDLVNQLVSHNIDTVVFGYNKGQKQDIKLGKKTNQNFVSIPFAILRQMLEYKCRLVGIEFIEQEEAYTSKCSFIDKEELKEKEEYLGERKKRGLYQTQSGKKINADINGSLNIGRKYLEKKGLYTEEIHNELISKMHNPKRKTI